MSRPRPTVLLLGLALLGCADSAPPPPEGGFLLGGIQVNEPDMRGWHRQLRRSGFNAVSLTTYARQGRWDRAELEVLPAEQNADLLAEIRSAREQGLRVALIPRVALDHAVPENTFLWHGLILPTSDAELEEWFRQYGDFVLGWARVAEAEGVELLGLGSELSTLTSTREVTQLPELEEYYLNAEKQQRERDRTLGADGAGELGPRVGGWDETHDDLTSYLDERERRHAAWARTVTGGGSVAAVNERRRELDRHWRELIARVREVYRGRLTYAANFDQYQQVGFWDALDVIGVNAYFPLRGSLEAAPGSAELERTFEAAWDAVIDDFERLVEQDGLEGRPFVFTEIGYTRRLGGTLEPWAGDGFAVVDEDDGSRLVVWREQEIDPSERVLAVRALRSRIAARAPGLLDGLLWWKLSTLREHHDIEAFLLVLDDRPPDPLMDELAAFRAP